MQRPFRALLLLALLCAVLAACGGATGTTTVTPTAKGTGTSSATIGVPSTSLQLSGLVKNPGMFALSDLQAFPKVTVSVNVQPLGAHTFGGALLYDVLQKAQVTTLSNRKNDLLRKSIVVSGTDKYTVAVAWERLIQLLPTKWSFWLTRKTANRYHKPMVLHA